jgi:hypothetical protein
MAFARPRPLRTAMHRYLRCTLSVILFTFAASTLYAQSLAWNANTETDLAGYKVFIGTQSGTYGTPIDVGKVTAYTPQGVDWTRRMYFAVKAYNTSGMDSPFSAEAVWTPASITKVTSLTANVASPLNAGSPVTWTAVGSNNLGPVEYKFYINKLGTNWVLGQDWSTNNTFTWTPQSTDAGTPNYVQVWARAVGSTAAYEAYLGTPSFTINGPSISKLTSLTANVSYPLVVASPVTWTAVGSNNFGNPLEYKFYIFKKGTTWVLGQDWSSANTFTWTPQASDVGTPNYVQVWTRVVGSTATYEAYLGTPAFDINPAPLLLTANVDFPTPPGNQVTWTATLGTPPASPVEYKFQVVDLSTNTATLLRDYSSSNKVQWTPTAAGQYVIQAFERIVGSPAAFDFTASTPALTVSATPLTITSFTASTSFPTTTGTPITFTARVKGGMAGPIQYVFWIYSVQNGWRNGQPWGTSETFTWTPTWNDQGDFAVQVWVRNNGSTATYDAYLGTQIFHIDRAALQFTTSTLFPAAQGTQITWVSGVADPSVNMQYQFWLYTAASDTWSMLQDYSPQATYVWTPTVVGTYGLQVWARQVGSTAFYDLYRSSGLFDIVSAPPQVVSLTTNVALPATAGTTITWTAGATGGSAPLQYQFWRQDAGTWTMVQDYSSLNTYTWPTTAGDKGQHAVQVRVRSTGNTSAFEAQMTSGTFQIN